MLRFDWWHWKLAVLIGLSASAVGAADLSDIQTHMPGVLQDNFGKGTTDYSSYAPRIKFPITDYPSTLNSQVRNKGGSNLGGDQCDQTNFTPVWWDTLCETRKSKDSPPLGCPLTTVHQGVDIRGGTPATCKALRTARQNLVPVVAVEDGTIRYIGDYAVDLWPRSGVRYRYLHMNMKGLKVQLNQKVTAGQIIGYMYNDFGGTSTTFHLHFEHWMNISGVGFRPVPVYCDLISAYEKDKGVKSSMLGGGQKCEASTSSDGQEQPAQPAAPDVVENAKVSSYWQYGSSEVGLIAEGASRRFLYTKPDLNVPHPARAGDMIFDGRKEGENYVGKARLPGDTCGDDTFEVNGPIANEGKTVNLTGSRNRHGAECSTSGITQENLRLDFVRRISDSGATTTTCGPSPDRQFKTEITRNWGAITMYVPFDNWLSYIKMWPGLKVDGNGQPVDVQIDKLGGSIMAFETDESGVGIWWYWLLVRKGYGSDGIPVRNPTFVQLARGIAGTMRVHRRLTTTSTTIPRSRLYISGGRSGETSRSC